VTVVARKLKTDIEKREDNEVVNDDRIGVIEGLQKTTTDGGR